MESKPDDLIRVADVRRMLGGICRETLYRYRRDRNFPRPVVIASQNFWRVGDVRAWIDSHREAAA